MSFLTPIEIEASWVSSCRSHVDCALHRSNHKLVLVLRKTGIGFKQLAVISIGAVTQNRWLAQDSKHLQTLVAADSKKCASATDFPAGKHMTTAG